MLLRGRRELKRGARELFLLFAGVKTRGGLWEGSKTDGEVVSVSLSLIVRTKLRAE